MGLGGPLGAGSCLQGLGPSGRMARRCRERSRASEWERARGSGGLLPDWPSGAGLGLLLG